MMSPLPFDTHAYVKRLIAAGMPEAQAEVQAQALAEIVLAQVATKDDLRQAVAELKRDIGSLRDELKRDGASLRDELKRDIELVETRLGGRLEAELRKQLIWFFGMLVVLGGALAALLRALPAAP
ncbi:MAG: DUF1640 domain-containing protein [Candidatus Lambdaproteobacteria bacterium]|nr:DUF1640 domain-containing protein [Candidatus Lambdaproteobacteria bacterium]